MYTGLSVPRRQLLAGMAALSSLAGCGPLGRYGREQAALKPARLEAWTHLSVQGHRDTITQLAAAFMSAQPQISVEWTFVPSGSWLGLMEKLTPALAANTPPDMTYMSAGRLDTLRRQGQVLDLDALIARSRDLRAQDFDKTALGNAKFAGKTWGLPFSGNPGRLGYYNTALFAQENITTPPRSWDELLSQARRLTKIDASGAMAQMGFKGHTGAAWAWNPFLVGNGGEVYDRSGPVPKPAWHSPQGIDSLQFLVDLIHKHRVWSITAEPVGGERAGKVGLWILAGSFVIGDYVRLPDLKWDAFRPPGKTGPKPALAQTGADYLNLYQTPRQEAAWAYAGHMTNTESLARWATTWGGPPPRASSREHKVFKDFVAATPGMRVVVEQMADPETRPDPGFHGEAEAYAELLKHYRRALRQEATPRDALTEAAREATVALERLYK